jgi:antitoxin VapB
MAILNIKDAETHRLAAELAQSTGQTLTAAVKQAIREQLLRVRAGAQPGREREVQRWLAMARKIAEAGERDARSADEIIGFDEFGLPQ